MLRSQELITIRSHRPECIMCVIRLCCLMWCCVSCVQVHCTSGWSCGLQEEKKNHMNIIFPRNYMGHAGLDILWSSKDIVCAHIPLWQCCLCAFDLLGVFAIGKCHYFILFHCIALHCCKLHLDLGLADDKTYKKNKTYRFTLKWPNVGLALFILFYFSALHQMAPCRGAIFSKQSDLGLAENQTCKQKKKKKNPLDLHRVTRGGWALFNSASMQPPRKT